MSDQEHVLIRQAQDGHVESFELLIRSHQDRLLRLALAIAGNQEDAEDALQETLLQAYRALPGFRCDSSFGTWLYRIAINRTRNWVRLQVRGSSERFAERAALVGAVPPAPVEQELFARERRRCIRTALLKLPDHYRQTILLRHYLDMAYEDIADVLSIPVGTVRSRLAKARALLLREMDRQGYGSEEESEAFR